MRITCLDCGLSEDDCDCDNPLFDPKYDEGYELVSRSRESMWRYSDVLPSTSSDAVTMGEGNTPLIQLPRTAEKLGVREFYVKDEGWNPTGSVYDREMSATISAIAGKNHETETVDGVALFSPGNSGVSAASYAARSGLDCDVFVPSRSRHDVKSMINVHGGNMTVVRGRIDEAEERFMKEFGSGEIYSVAPFETPYRHDGAKTVGYEIIEQADVDHVVCPVATGSVYLGLDKSVPENIRVHAVQPEGCAPVVRAVEEEEYERWESPDTVVGELEVTFSKAGPIVAEKIRDGRGRAVKVGDDTALERGLEVAEEGIEPSPEGCVGIEGAARLNKKFDEFGDDDVVVSINPSAGRLHADVLRSRLMSHGV